MRSFADIPESPGQEWGDTERAVLMKESVDIRSVMLGIGVAWLASS